MSKIPDLPGTPVTQYEHEKWLKDQVRVLCGLENPRFPGAQPVSFGMKDLARLESQDFWVCEKSDGIRVLLFVHTNLSNSEQNVYLIDRHNTYRMLDGLYFPHHENPIHPLRSTIVDGELVVDTDPVTQRETLRFLVFDCLVVDNQNVMNRHLDKRYGRLTEWFYKPYSRMIKDHPHMVNTQPFDIKVKVIQAAYHAEQIFNVDIPKLQHGNDGLIYTCVNAPYSPGTDENIMKWKPPTENSIDFKLVLRFPPLHSDPSRPDFSAKPVFLLKAWCGEQRYEQYDELYVDDDEWESMKLSGEQYDDRIIEVHWDPNVSRWRMMRFRNDKPNGNHINVVEKIIDSIADGVDKDTLLSRCNAIRVAWKTRQGQPVTQEPHTNPRPAHNPPAKRPLLSTHAEIRFGPIQSSIWSKVSGPEIVAGFQR